MTYTILNFLRKQGHFKYLSLLFILWLIYFWRVFLLGQVFYLGDSFAFDVPHRIFFVNSIKNGEVPLWNPYILAGVPFLLIASHGLLNPSTLLFFVLKPEVAMTFATVLNILFAGIMMYCFVFLMTKDKKAAFLAGLIYMFSGFSANASMAIIINQEFPLVPLVFITMHLLIFQKKRIFLFLTAFLFALQFISGFPFVPYLSALGITIYYLLGSKEKLVQKIFSLFIIALFAFGFSAFLFLPQLEAAKLSTRPPFDYFYATSHSLHPLSLITFIFPHFYGIGEIEYKFNTHNRNYLGLIPLFGVIYVIFRKKNLISKSILILAISGFFLAFGRYFPLYRLFLLIPGLSNFREPEFFIMWYVFGGSIIAGIGISNFIKKLKIPNFSLGLKVFLLFLAAFLLVLILYLNFAPLPNLIPKIEKLRSLLIINLSNLLFSTLLITITIFFIKKLNRAKLFIFITLLIFADLYFLNQSEFFLIKRSDYQKIFVPHKIPIIIKENKDMFRIHSTTYDEAPRWDNFSRESFLQKKIRTNTNVLFPNRNMAFDIPSVDGFSPLLIKSYADFLTDNKSVISGITSYDVENTSDKLSKAAGKYILSSKKIPEYMKPRYQLLEENPPYYFLYEDTQARNRVFLLDKKSKKTGSVSIISAKADSITLQINNPVEANLILLDTYYPGWQAFINNQKTEIKPFENTFKQIEIPQGNHIASFFFKPQSFFLGLKITLFTFSIVLLYLFYKLFC